MKFYPRLLPPEEMEIVRGWAKEGGTPYNRALGDLICHVEALEKQARQREADLGRHRGYYDACRRAEKSYNEALATLTTTQPLAEVVDNQRQRIARLEAEAATASWQRMVCLAALDAFTGDAPDHLRVLSAPIIREALEQFKYGQQARRIS